MTKRLLNDEDTKRWAKAYMAYAKAEGALRALRNELLPPGTKVVCNYTGCTHTVTAGSLYADQVYLDSRMHTGLHSLSRKEAAA